MNIRPSRPGNAGLSRVTDTSITLSHGSGGIATRELIEEIFLESFENPYLSPLEDQARFALADLMEKGDRLAFTTDSYVVSPLFFAGGDIGSLAVNGTVNDLAVGGAIPLYLSCGFILEEGLPIDTLRQVVASMKRAADSAGARVVTGDTKVVHRGAADKMFINTAGVGIIRANVDPAANRLQVGDRVIVNGFIGDHGTAILVARGELALECTIESDCQALASLIHAILEVCPEVRAMRDATRGGLGTVLNEFARSSGVGIRVWEGEIPVREEVRGTCELLGLDPLYLANEGKLVLVVPGEAEKRVLDTMRSHPHGLDSACIGEVVRSPGGVVFLRTAFGVERVLDRMFGEPLPRIC